MISRPIKTNPERLPETGNPPEPSLEIAAKPVQRRLLIPLAAVSVLLIGGFGAVLLHFHYESQRQLSRQVMRDVTDQFERDLNGHVDSMRAIQGVLLRNRDLIRALKAGDKDRLLADHELIFAQLRQEHSITHFYFHRPDRVNLLRVHKPEKSGDLIDRFTALEAERTGKTAFGIELGPLGTYTLRVVQPVFDGDTLVGYIELGKEIEDVLASIHAERDIELAVTIYKSHLNRAKWEAGMHMLAREANWDRIDEKVLIYTSQRHFPDQWDHFVAEEGHVHWDLSTSTAIDGKQWQILAQPLFDVSGAEMGDLLVFHDRSESVALFRKTLAESAAVAAAILTALIGCLYLALRRVDRSIVTREATLAKSERIQRSLTETSPDFIFILDREMIVRVVNRTPPGQRKEDVIGRPAVSLMPPEHRDGLRRAFAQALKTGALQVTETAERRGDVEHFFLNRLNPLPGTDAEMAVMLISTDITERKLVERQIERYADELEGQQEELKAQHEEIIAVNASLEEASRQADLATQAKSDFLANMSHEIRTPMTAILGFSENMLDAEQSDSDRLNCVHTIRRNGEYLLGIINDILDLSKIEAGKMAIERGDCRPCHVIAEVASLMRIRADAKGLLFNVEYIDAIPETIQCDPTRLRQILINLIGNAIKFTEIGGVRLVTRFVAIGNAPYLQFDLIDTGRGMTREQVARLFQPFVQADNSTTRKFGGTGLGLTISKRFAELLGGNLIVATTELGVGTTFRATVTTGPLDGVRMLEDPSSATVVANSSDTASRVLPSDLQGLRILLAEDGPDNQRLISFVLKKAGRR